MAKKKNQKINIKRVESDDNMDYLLNEPKYKKRHGALTGALLGGAIGAGVSKKNRLAGGLIGAGIGGLGGFSMVKNRNDWQEVKQKQVIDKFNKFLDSGSKEIELTDNEGIFLGRLQEAIDEELKNNKKKQANYLQIKAAKASVVTSENYPVVNAGNNIYDFFQGLRPKSIQIEHSIPQDEVFEDGKNVIRPRIVQRGEITNNNGSKVQYTNMLPTVSNSTTVDDILNNSQKSTVGNANAELIYDYLRAGKSVPHRFVEDPTEGYIQREEWPSDVPEIHGNVMESMPSDVAISSEGKIGTGTNISYDKDPKGWERLANQVGKPWLYSDPNSYTMYKNLFGIGGGLVGGLGGYGLGSGVSRLLGWNKPKDGKEDKHKSKRRWLKGLSALGGAGLGIYLGRKAGQPWDEDHFRYEYDPATATKNHKWLGESQYYKDRMNYALNRQLEGDREIILDNAKKDAVSNLNNILRTANLSAYIK